ncbi:MAG: glycosyl hydrolase family 38 [Isosphaeraceae bacterium]
MSMPMNDPWPSDPESNPSAAADVPAPPDEPPPGESPVESVPEAAPDARTVITLIAHNGLEPPAGFTDRQARASWCAVSAAWHPRILARAAGLPRIEDVHEPSPAGPRDLVIVAEGQSERLPSGYRTSADDSGAAVLEGTADRPALVAEILQRMEAGSPIDSQVPDEEAASLAEDFQALGTCAWWLRDLTIGMGHADLLDQESLAREVLHGARAWVSGDLTAARNRLMAAFEVLTQARERLYPVDAYLIDLCLIDPAMPGGVLHGPLDRKTPVTFIAPASAIEAQANLAPESLMKLREAVNEGRADVAGGTFGEADEPFLPLDSIVWQFRRGGEVYREHLDGRNVETLARRRFGLYPQLPQLAKRYGFRFALHLGLDAGRFPIRPEAKRLWESPDRTHLETLCRVPLAADRSLGGVQIAWRLAHSMRDDHVATLPLVHWPAPLADWYLDLTRVISYSPVLARSVTLNDFFHLTDRPYETFAPSPDDYVTPYLAQAVAKQDPAPISRKAAHARLRSRLNAVSTMKSLAEGLGNAAGDGPPDTPSIAAVESDLETGALDRAAEALDRLEPFWSAAVARGVLGAGTTGRPGYLVLNPTGIARRAAVTLPDAALDLRPEGPLRASQFTEEGVVAVVELPAFGFAWVPRDANHEASPAPVGNVTVRDRVLKNESITIEIDPATGGLRGVKAAGEDLARLGQQLVVTGLKSADGKSVNSRMSGESFEVEYGGPALAQAVTKGVLLGPDDRRLGRFRQRFRLWTGRPLLEIQVTLEDLDPAWLDSIASADPWAGYLACRWAWPDPSSMLRRTALLTPELTEAERPETPDAFDISTRRQRTALVFGGLAHHRRCGPRMLDTLLVSGRESAREFTLGVALDLEHPFQASADLIEPVYAVPTNAGPPRGGPTGWLYAVDSKAVAVTRVEYLPPVEESRGWGLAFHMLETAGQSVRCRLRTFKAPTWARQTDFHSEVIVDLPTDDDAVLVDLTPHELARVEVILG